jgi:hypothetical protein
MNLARSVSFFAVTLIWASSAGAADRIKLFDFPGADRTGLQGINDRGVAVGGALIFPDGFSFTVNLRSDELAIVTPPPGDITMLANGINNAGVIVGAILNSDDVTGPGFLRHPDGSFSFFSHPRCHEVTDARTINERGLVTGSCNTPEGTTVGFLYNSNTGEFVDIAPTPFVFMHGINMHGTVVGQAMFPADSNPCGGGGPPCATLIEYGLVRYPNGTITLFQLNGQQTDAGDIDDEGLIVGSAFDPKSNTDRLFATHVRREACVIRPFGRRKFLSPPGTEIFATGTNDFGRIVGIAFVSGDGPHGFYRGPSR